MLEDNRTVSVLIPTYHRPKLLMRAVDSVMRQSYQDTVIRISDNGTDFETKDFCERLTRENPNVFYTRNNENIGPINNIRKLISCVDTGFYCILSDDDFLFPDFISDCMSSFCNFPDIAFSCAKSIVIDQRLGSIDFRNSDWAKGFYSPSSRTVQKMRKSHFTSTAVVFRKEVIENFKGFHSVGDDALFLVMLSASFPFYVMDEIGAAFVINSSSFTGAGGIGRHTRLGDLCDALISDFSIIYEHVEPSLQREVAAIFFSNYSVYFRQRHQFEGLRNQFESVDEQLYFNTLSPIFSGVLGSLYSIAFRLSPSLTRHVVRPILKGLMKYRAKFYQSKSLRKVDDELIPYLCGDIQARDLFLNSISKK